MTYDYKQLCAELHAALEKHDLSLADDQLLDRSAAALRAALAEPEPQGPTDKDIEEWADACHEVPPMELDVHGWRLYFTAKEFSETIRAAIARWGNHPGFPDRSGNLKAGLTRSPVAGEVAGIAEWLKKRGRLADLGTKDWYFRAADLLEQLSPPRPVPVSERLPGPGDCDEEGRCWWWYPEVPGKTYGYWAHEDAAVPERALNEQPTHWLPAHALPQPS